MTRYLALLGSISIGGNRVKMVDLKAAMAKVGFGEVTTAAASGNVILQDQRAPKVIETAIAGLFKTEFGFNSCVMLRSRDEVVSAI